MTTDDRLKALQDEFQTTKDELKQILYDMRTYIMEAQTPIPNDLEKDKLDDLYSEWDSARKETIRAQQDAEKQKETHAQSDS